jgi:cysteine desulfurase
MNHPGMKFPIYLDYSATTPVDPRVAQKMIPYLTEHYGNPASRSHALGWKAEEAVDEARASVAALVNCDPRELVWTSGATESINLALKGAAEFYKSKGRHLITVKTEHKATLDTCRELERRGFEVTYMEVGEDGMLDLAAFEAAFRPDTILASVMSVNNEIGVVQDIEAIGEMCRKRGVLFHVDSAQATGKIAIDLAALKVDMMSFSAHKTYGPKGVGALYVRRKPRVRLEAQIHGGGHERGFRSGTLATHQIVGMGEAFRVHGRLPEVEGGEAARDVAALGDAQGRRGSEYGAVGGALSRRDVRIAGAGGTSGSRHVMQAR